MELFDLEDKLKNLVSVEIEKAIDGAKITRSSDGVLVNGLLLQQPLAQTHDAVVVLFVKGEKIKNLLVGSLEEERAELQAKIDKINKQIRERNSK